MDEENLLYQKKYEREKLARLCAEDLLEEKSRELYELNEILESKNSLLLTRIKSAFAATGDGIWEKDLLSNNVWLSERMSELVTGKREEQDLSWEEASTFLHPKDKKNLFAAFGKLLEGDTECFPITINLKNTKNQWCKVLVRGRVLYNELGEASSIIGSVTDVTDLIMAKEKTRALSKFPEKNPRPIMQFDEDAQLLYSNPAAKKLVQDFSITEEKMYNSLPMSKCSFKEEGVLELEFTLNDRYFLCTLANWIEHDRPVTSIYLLDVTERHEHQEELEKARKRAEEASKAKSDFLSTMSHELRTPLNGIIGLSEVLKSTTSFESNHQHVIETIYNSSHNLLGLINDVLDFSKIEAGEFSLVMQTFNVAELLSDTLEIFKITAEKKGLDFHVHKDESCKKLIYNDELRLRQVLNNIVGNALKFTEKGSVTVRAYCGEYQDEDCIYFEVEDTGIGIQEEKQDIIFNKFESLAGRDVEGTGLGLAISNKLAEMMGGSIFVESHVNAGTCFKIAIPMNLEKVNHNIVKMEAQNTVIEAKHIKDKTILIVDDHPVNLLTLKMLLENMGVQHIVEASSAKAALELIERNKDIELIIMDYHMPEMDGLEAGRKIKSNNPSLSIIIATADAMKETQALCAQYKMDAYITKPITKASLEACLYPYLDSSKKEQGLPAHKPDIQNEAINVDHLTDIIGDSEQMKERFYKLYLQQAISSLADLKTSMVNKEYDLWRSHAHKLKGASANLGAFTMAEICKSAEHIDEGSNTFPSLFNSIQTELLHIVKFIERSYLGEKQINT